MTTNPIGKGNYRGVLFRVISFGNCLCLYVDLGEIYTRLFDARPFLSAELSYFVKEFEVRNALNTCIFIDLE